MIRILDFTLSLTGIILLSPILVILFIIGLFDTGSPLFIQERLGKDQNPFKLIKFRTMRVGVDHVGTHLANASDITPFGRFLRKSKLDEIPQLINVLLGQMSLVGPRPGLPSQNELNKQREERNVFNYKPGITGLGQINEIDMSTPRKLSRYDELMLKKMGLCFYTKTIIATIAGHGRGDRIKN